MRVKAFLLIIFLAFGAQLRAQEVRGVINGTAADAQGAPMSGVKIHVKNVDTGVAYDSATNEVGYYEVPFLMPGNYTVVATNPGFNTLERSAIVTPQAEVTVNFKMTIGAASTTITVSGASPLLNVTDADFGTPISEALVQDVGASIYRNVGNYPRFAPGVTGQSLGTYTSTNSTSVLINGGGGGLNIGANSASGTQGGANEWIVDGVPDTLPTNTGLVTVMPTVENVQDMRVDTTMIDASLGHSTGGAIIVSTRSGTNDLHGTGYAFGRWTGLFANVWQNDRNHIGRTPENYKLWGYFLGGPVDIPHIYDGKNKTFWTSTYESDLDLRPNPESFRIPTPAEAAGVFDANGLNYGVVNGVVTTCSTPNFTTCIPAQNTRDQNGSHITLYNPYSTVVTGGSFTSRQQFQCVTGTFTPMPVNANGTQNAGTPCNIIPPALMNPTGQAVLNYIEAQAAAHTTWSCGTGNTGTPCSATNPTVVDQIGVANVNADGNVATYQVGQSDLSERVDHAISDKQHFFAEYSRLTRNQHAPPIIFGAQQYNGSGSNLDTFLQNRQAVTLGDSYAFSPTFIMSLGFGFLRYNDHDTYGSFGSAPPSDWNLPSILAQNQYIAGMPNFAVTNDGSGEMGVSIGARANLIVNNGWATFVTFTKVSGDHTFKFGLDYRIQQFNSASQAVQAAGQFNSGGSLLQANPTLNSSSQTTGSGVAEMLMGLADSGSLTKAAPQALTNQYVAGFFQDTWKVNRKLSLTLGLRYDLETPYFERHNYALFGFNPAGALPIANVNTGNVVVAPANTFGNAFGCASLTSCSPSLAGGLIFAGGGYTPRSEGSIDYHNFGPRFGFAYNPFSRTVIRGGYALFYSPMSDILSDLGLPSGSTFSPNTLYNAISNFVPNGYTSTSTVTNGTSLMVPSSFVSLSNPFPSGLTPIAGSTPGPIALLGTSPNFLYQGRVSPYNQQWTLGIQQELSPNTLLDIAYVGMLSVKELESFNLDDLALPFNVQANTQSVKNPFLTATCTGSAPHGFCGTFGGTNPFPATTGLGSNATVPYSSLLTAFPQFSSLTEDGFNSGVTEYDALQTLFQKRFSHGLSTLASFALQKSMHNNVESLVNQGYLHNFVDPAIAMGATETVNTPQGPLTFTNNSGANFPGWTVNWRSIGAYDQPKVFNGSIIYDVPFTWGGSGVAGGILRGLFGGWEITNNLSWQSGLPVSVTGTNGRPIVVGDPRTYGPINQRLGLTINGVAYPPYWNPAAFKQLSSQYFPWISPTAPYQSNIRAPGLDILNTAILKTFDIKEKVHIQLRGEAYNTFNHPFYGTPNSNTSSSSFGQITSASLARECQVGMKVSF